MTALAIRQNESLRRWTISIVVVVLMHGAIAMALLAWRNIIVPAQPTGPVVINLAPAPITPPTHQPTVPPAPQEAPSVPLPHKPRGHVEEKAEEKTASQGEEKTSPSPFETAPQVTSPATSTPSDSTHQQEGGQTRAATGGAVPGASPSQGREVNPLDTRIGEPHLRFQNASKPNGWKKTIMGRPSKMPLHNFGGRHAGQGRSSPSDVAGGWARNSIGMLTPDPANAAKGSNGGDASKDALGMSGASGDNGITRNAGTITNALGITVPIRTRMPRTSIGQHGGTGILAATATMTPGGVNGTGMVRSNSGAAAIGGPVKSLPGGLNGTTIRRR